MTRPSDPRFTGAVRGQHAGSKPEAFGLPIPRLLDHSQPVEFAQVKADRLTGDARCVGQVVQRAIPAGQRVFSFKVQGTEFKDFDPWVKAGGFCRAYIETVPVEVTDGKIKITFTPKVENPQICAIEILAQ